MLIKYSFPQNNTYGINWYGPLPVDDNEEGVIVPPILCPLNEAQCSLLSRLCVEDNGNSESFGTGKYLVARSLVHTMLQSDD